MFELRVKLPVQKDLCIRLMDYDLVGADDLIGETWIDLENRVLSRHRATQGLQPVFNQYILHEYTRL